MKKKYMTESGTIIELTDQEFIEYPFNVKLRLIKDDKVRKPIKVKRVKTVKED